MKFIYQKTRLSLANICSVSGRKYCQTDLSNMKYTLETGQCNSIFHPSIFIFLCTVQCENTIYHVDKINRKQPPVTSILLKKIHKGSQIYIFISFSDRSWRVDIWYGLQRGKNLSQNGV